MESKDVIEIRIKSIKRSMCFSVAVFIIELLLKGIIYFCTTFGHMPILYENYIYFDIILMGTILWMFYDVIKLCDALLDINDRTSAPKDKQD